MLSQSFLSLSCLLLLLQQAAAQTPIFPTPATESRDYWQKQAVSDLTAAKQVYKQLKHNAPNNVLFFLGDGLGVSTVTAGRIFKGQRLNQVSGEEAQLSFERLPHTALAKTYNVDRQTPDSAGTATAYLGGVKGKSGSIGVDQRITPRNCSSYSQDNDVISFVQMAANIGKSVGIVTTTRITHATPAGGYAHTVWRDWEDDTARNRDVPGAHWHRCPDIAEQLITKSPKLSVIFGGGRLKFLPKNMTTSDRVNNRIVNGSRSDGVNLVTRWKQVNAGRRARYIETRDELMSLPIDTTDTVLGLFATSHLRYDLDNQADATYKEPTLAEMTQKAIEILSKNPKGFVLLVEGGRIDHAHHENKAAKALGDVIAFDAAITAGMSQTRENETLTIVTADHSHVFTIGMWADRGTNVLGKVRFSYDGNYNRNGDALAFDNMPFTSLSYGDGPSATINGPRPNLTATDTTNKEFRHNSLVYSSLESHAAEDVVIYASGPAAHLFHSTHEQSYIGNVVMHALCVGQFKQTDNCFESDSASTIKSFAVIPAVLFTAALQLFT